MSEQPLLQVHNLKTYFYTEDGVMPSVDGVDFDLHEGETLAIVGESGCGKSVTSLSIMGLVQCPPGKIEAGEILYHSKDLLKISKKEMRSIRGNEISMIFQEPMTSLNPVFTVGRQIMESFIIHQKLNKKEARTKAIEMIRMVGIPDPEKVVDKFEEAAADFVMASRLIPDNWDVWYHLGLSYFLMGRYEDAAVAYKRCYALSNPAKADDFCAITDWRWRTYMRLGRKEDATALLKNLPDGYEKAADVCGYTLNCAMYQGKISPEDLMKDRLVDGHLDAITSLYALSNYYYVMGDMDKSNELVDKCLEFADANQWCSFGYLAARVDKAARAK